MNPNPSTTTREKIFVTLKENKPEPKTDLEFLKTLKDKLDPFRTDEKFNQP